MTESHNHSTDMASGGSDASGGGYLVRLIQSHETFRRPEIEALAKMAGVPFEYVCYSEYVCS